jgi:DNA-binding XRE family transcriptional regulator
MTKRERVKVTDRTVTLPRAEYERLLVKAGEEVEGDGPPLPKPDANGNFPAIAYARASIARELIRTRRAAGMSQTELAELAGVRRETISRLESAKATVTDRVMQKIERAIRSRSRKRSA